MFRMGSTCSMQRQHMGSSSSSASGCGGRRKDGRTKSFDGTGTRRSLRHSVISAIPDNSIANLYPKDDNYVNVGRNRRSPKSLTELCVDALCRSLPNLNGALPPGLPQDVVDDVIQSLLQHSALNATTLSALRHCELGALSLAGCRGVTDAWLEPLAAAALSSASLSSSSSRTGNSSPGSGGGNSTTCSPTSSPQLSPKAIMTHDTPFSGTGDMECMDLADDLKPSDIFYATFESHRLDDGGSACSSASFVSATSNLHPSFSSSEDHPMMMLTTDEMHTYVAPPSPPILEDTKISSYSFPTSSVTSSLTLLDIRGSQGLTDRGLLQLTDLCNLEVARLDNCHALTGRGLLAFSRSHRLHTLSLANCRRLTDEAVINISHLLTLQALSLDGCRCLTDRSLAALSDLYGLRKLDLSQCDLITDEGVEQLEHLEALEELSLGWCRQVTDQGIKTLTNQPQRGRNLRILRLARCTLTDEGVRHLALLSALEELDLNGCNTIGSAALRNALERMPKLSVLDVSYCPGIIRSGWQGKINALKSLELCYSGVKDAHICKFLNLSALEELNLDSCLISDSAIAHLADNDVVPNLTSLDLADTPVTDIAMAKIGAKFTKLTRLSLFYCNISNGGLRHIAQLTDLEVLNLDSRDISDDGLAHLRNLTKLKSLDIFSGRITDSGCAHIARLKSLQSLELCGGGVGDLGCTLLATLDNLTSLNLSQNERITNRGAAALAALTNLKALNLSNTRVNSAALKFFSGLLQLQSLALYGCSGIDADEPALGKLHHGLPNLKCVRLNTADDEDGMVVAGEDDEDDELDADGGSDGWAAEVAGAAHEMDEDVSLYSDHD